MASCADDLSVPYTESQAQDPIWANDQSLKRKRAEFLDRHPSTLDEDSCDEEIQVRAAYDAYDDTDTEKVLGEKSWGGQSAARLTTQVSLRYTLQCSDISFTRCQRYTLLLIRHR